MLWKTNGPYRTSPLPILPLLPLFKNKIRKIAVLKPENTESKQEQEQEQGKVMLCKE